MGQKGEIEASLEEVSESEKSVFDGLEGVYLGFSPTEASDLGMGEIELTITKASIRERVATGMEIQGWEKKISELGVSEMATDEIKGLYNDPIDTQGTRAFKCGEEPWLVFTEDSEDGTSVRMFLGIPDLLGPTILFSPNQVSRGLFEKAVQKVEQEYGQKGIVPRLNNNGQALIK